MKKFIFFLGLTALTAISALAGGVAVGNGSKQVYRSPYGFSVQYDDGLALSVSSKESFSISNTPLVNAGEEISAVSFTVSRGEVTTPAQVAAVAKREHPDLAFQPARQPGAAGVENEAKTGDHLVGFYYYLTSNGDFVRIRLSAFTAANGLTWVAPIVRSFTYDLTPPTVLELRADSLTWKAGTTHQFWVHAVDDNAGIALRSSFLFFGMTAPGSTKKYVSSFYTGGPFEPQGNDWYTLTVKVNPFQPSGLYSLDLNFQDNAFNVTNLEPNEIDPSQFKQTNGPALPVLQISVENDGPSETTPPRFLGYRLDTPVWQAGKTSKIYFQAEDKVSGIQGKELRDVSLRSAFEINGHQIRSANFEHPRDEGDGWYSVEGTLDSYMPAGDYFIDGFHFQNGAGVDAYFDSYRGGKYYDSDTDQKDIPLIHIRVENPGTVDVTPPVLEEVKLDGNVWVAGQTYQLHFRAHDDQSGVFVSPTDAPHPMLHGYFSPTVRLKNNSPLYIDHPVIADGNGWYHVDVPVSPYLPPGEYYLDSFGIGDNARNGASERCDLSKPTCSNSNGPALPLLKITVVR